MSDPVLRRVLWRSAAAVAILAGICVWLDAALPLSRAVPGTGIVVSRGSSRPINHQDGGTAQEIPVGDGQLVAAGTVLLRFDHADAQQALAVAEASLRRLDLRAQRLRAERDGADWNPADPAAADEAALCRSRREAWRAEDLATEARAAKLDDEQRAIEGRLQATRHLEGVVVGQQAKLDALAKEQVIRSVEALAVEKELARIRENLAQLQGALTESGNAAAVLRRDQARRLAERRRDLDDAAVQTGEALLAANHAVAMARARLARCSVTAPVAGRICDLQVRSVGQAVAAGSRLLTLVPVDEALIVRAAIAQDDIAAVRTGMPAEVVIGAYRRSHPDPLSGRVLLVGADIQTDAKGAAFYQVDIAVDGPADAPLQSGMTAEVYIVAEDRSLLDYIAEPFRQQFRRALREE